MPASFEKSIIGVAAELRILRWEPAVMLELLEEWGGERFSGNRC